ncbi:MAG: hypothetical protein ACI9LM_000101 [Alteromonadaceae bacterium]|jgi:hypothetical protein
MFYKTSFTLLIIAGFYLMTRPNRNVRNNNPLNIRESADWEGESEVNKDKDFEEFTTPEYGFRAAYKILMTYRNKYDLRTISDIIHRWAPTSENDTQAYIDYVSKRVDASGLFGLYEYDLSREQYPQLMLAMADFEGAKGAFTLEQAEAGMSLA